MGHQSRQLAMLFVDIESLIPETHLLRKIERMVSFDFIYDLLAPYYPATGRPSVDPVSMFKMLLIGYLYGIKSERRLVEEVQLNIAYRWFCGFELDDTIPNHSTFSKTRTRKWQQSSLFQKAFYEIVKQCIDSGLIDGEAMAADGSYIPANVSRESWINVETEVEQSMQSYLDSLDEELSNQPGFKKPPTRIVRKCRTTSQTDPDSGYINHGSKRGIGYLMEATVDCKHGILTGVDVYSANEKESVLILRHLERQINLGIPMSRLALDRGYETGAVHRGLELLGITGYIPAIQFSNPPEKYGFSFDPQLDAFICPEGVPLTYHRLNCSKSTGKYLRCYQVEGDACMRCPKRPGCFDKAGIRRRVLASSCYPAFFRGHQRVGTPEFLSMMRLRKIWAEGSFSVLKREHCISKIRKRGILAATEECLLAAMALNLKRMAKCHLSLSPNLLFCWNHCGFQQFFCFCQQVRIINGARLVAGGKIHQAVLQRLCVMERKPAAGDHIRQPAVFIEEFVEIQIVVSHHKFHVHVRKLGLDVGGVLFIQVRRPQIHLDGFFLILRSPPGAARQEGNAHRQRQQQRSRAAPCSFFHRPIVPSKKSVPSRLLLPSKKHLQDVEHHIRKCFVLRISGFGHRKHAEKSLRSFDRSCRQIAPCLPSPAFQKSAKQQGPAKNDGGPSSAAG